MPVGPLPPPPSFRVPPINDGGSSGSKLSAKAGRWRTFNAVCHPAPPVTDHIAVPQPFDGRGYLAGSVFDRVGGGGGREQRRDDADEELGHGAALSLEG